MLKYIALIISGLLLTACSTKYSVEGQYPTPLVPAIPIDVALIADDDFSNYVFKDPTVGQSGITIELGAAQVGFFESLTNALFTGSEGAPKLTMKPEVLRFQYAFPRESQSQIYEVWIRYQISIEEPDGNPVTSWIVTGYGKTPTALLKSRTEAINAATNVALRDIGAQLSIGFIRQPDIALWLANNKQTAAL